MTLVTALVGCGSTAIELNGAIPTNAAIERLPLTLGVYYPPDLSGHVHTEEIPQHGSWNIDAGPAHVEMWQRLLAAMFERVVPVSGPTAPGSAADLILSPRVDEFQFSIPAQTKNSFYEVWIRYQVSVYTPNGELLTEFPHVAYGKSRSRTLSGDKAGIEDAAYWAFRDAGAFFARDFTRNPQVRDWLQQRLSAPEYEP